jgi:predicted nucleic-acid-binding protein
MRGLDTNVLVRFVTQDDPEQARRVNALFGAAHASGERFLVNAIVLCELVWVLKSAYGHSRDDIAGVLDAFLETPEVIIEDADLARRALTEWRTLGADFADFFLGHRNIRLGCDVTLTFDGRGTRSPVLGPA